MPYIKQAARHKLDKEIHELAWGIDNPGELNYAITRLVVYYLKEQGLSYTNIAHVTGVLGNVSQELYRRVVGRYEDKKATENGDVFEELL